MTQTPFPVKSRFADLFVDEFDKPLVAAWPSRLIRAEMLDADDLSAPLGLSPPSRRVIRDDPNDDDDSEPAAATKTWSKAPSSKVHSSRARDKPKSYTPKTKTKYKPELYTPPKKTKDKPELYTPPKKTKDKPELYTPPKKTKDKPELYTPPKKAKDKPELYTPPKKTKDKPELYTPPKKAKDKPEFYTPPKKAKDKPELYTPPKKTKDKPELYTPSLRAPIPDDVPAAPSPDIPDIETPVNDGQTITPVAEKPVVPIAAAHQPSDSPAANIPSTDVSIEGAFDSPALESPVENPIPPQDNDIVPAVDGADSEPPHAPPTAADPDDADGEDENKLSVEILSSELNNLTPTVPPAINNEQSRPNRLENFVNRVGDYVRNLINGIFDGSEESEPDAPTMIPVVLLPSRDPASSDDPSAVFRDGKMSQLELEDAVGRDPWTMCCATTFVYAVQAKYPGLSRETITEAFGNAADRQMLDESGKCVEDDGYVGSIYQFSQAFSENLGLDEYVDVSGIYETVEQARDAGAEMVKVEYSGSLGDTPIEHHTLLVGNTEIDPAPSGIDNILDDGTKHVEGAMALDWYPLP